MHLAHVFGGEIICADSRTIYRGLDVGAGKPHVHDRGRVRHHMVDLLEVDEFIGGATFRDRAREAVADIQARGKLALCVGGSRLLVETMIFDLAYRPLSAAERKRYRELGAEELRAILGRQHVALPLNHHSCEQLLRALDENRVRPRPQPIRPHTLVLAMPLLGEDELRSRISARLNEMLGAGLAREVRAMVARSGRPAESFASIGYSEWQHYLAHRQDISTVRETIVTNAINYAVAQRRWLKQLAQRCPLHWVASPDEAERLVREALASV
jgi:tRNA dimethylallyltransferase